MLSKNVKIKISIFTLSIVFSLFLLESSLFLFEYYFNKTKIFEAVTVIDREFSSDQDYKFEINIGTNIKKEIICIGDSYTNGGNLIDIETYPYLLWKELDEVTTVRNLGVCESTTQVALKNFDAFIHSDQFVANTSYTFVFLIGAADIFSSRIDMEYTNNNTLSFSWKHLTKDSLSVVNIRSFRLFQFIFNASIDRLSQIPIFLSMQLKSEENNNYFSTLLSCLKSSDRDCIIDHSISPLFLHYFLSKYAAQEKLTLTQKLGLSLRLLRANPVLVNSDDFLHEIMVNSERQSKYSIELIIQETLIASKKVKKIEPFVIRIIKNMKHRQHLRTKLLNQQKDTYRKIISLAKKYDNIKLLLMTYPLAYQSTNNIIREIAQQNNINIIDLENVFKEKIKTPNGYYDYITDWEHCTKKGYKLIAEMVKNQLSK